MTIKTRIARIAAIDGYLVQYRKPYSREWKTLGWHKTKEAAVEASQRFVEKNIVRRK